MTQLPVTQVAAAVLLRNDGQEFMLACRPEGKVYAGYWEFPGGKVEPGESMHQALVREIQEELGITVTQATPWLNRQFVYPHAHVHIQFWRVTAWEGEIGDSAPLEHSAVAWQNVAEPSQLAPMLPANSPILKALSLPCRMLITQAVDNGIEQELQRVHHGLQEGFRLIQIRDRSLPSGERLMLAERITELAQPFGATILISEDVELARQVKAQGVHFTSSTLHSLAERPEGFEWVGASCHNIRDLRQAETERLGLDYVLLGPVCPTPSHPEAQGLGWQRFAENIAGFTLPVFAVGGQRPEMLQTAQTYGAHGIATIRNI